MLNLLGEASMAGGTVIRSSDKLTVVLCYLVCRKKMHHYLLPVKFLSTNNCPTCSGSGL